jgi:hypothetical protein
VRAGGSGRGCGRKDGISANSSSVTVTASCEGRAGLLGSFPIRSCSRNCATRSTWDTYFEIVNVIRPSRMPTLTLRSSCLKKGPGCAKLACQPASRLSNLPPGAKSGGLHSTKLHRAHPAKNA